MKDLMQFAFPSQVSRWTWLFGVLIFNKDLYQNKVPDNPGGGTVDWTNPWGEHKYVDDVQQREDGGTPAFLQTIKTALCFRLKERDGN